MNMISGWTFVAGAIVVGIVLFILGCAKVSGECSRQEEADAWEEAHRKDRDGSGV